MKSLDQIIGLPVITADAKNIGVVKDLGIDVNSWNVTDIEVSEKKKLLQLITENIYLPAGSVRALSDALMLDMPADEVVNSTREGPHGKLANTMLGTDIILNDACKIGSADMLFFKDLEVICIRVRPERSLVDELNINRMQPLYLKVEDIKAAGDMIILDISKNELTTFPKN